MFAIKSLNEFIQQPYDILKKCQDGPIEISAEEQSYVIMKTEYLRHLLTDTSLATELGKIFVRLKNRKGVPEKKIMSILGHE